MDFGTMAMSIAFILARPARELHSVPRPRKLLSAIVLAPMLQYAILYAIQHGVAQVMIKRACEDRPEYYKVMPGRPKAPSLKNSVRNSLMSSHTLVLHRNLLQQHTSDVVTAIWNKLQTIVQLIVLAGVLDT